MDYSFVGSAVERPLEGTDRRADRRVHVGQGRGDDARGEGRRVESVFSVEHVGDVQGFPRFFAWLLAVDQPKKMRRLAQILANRRKITPAPGAMKIRGDDANL